MKVKVKKLPTRRGMAALDAWFLWFTGKMPGYIFERVCLKHGWERRLLWPGHGDECPSNGEHEGIQCRCDNCDYALECFPEMAEQ